MKSELNTIVFSKNRTAQLELLLHSLSLDQVTVLYTYDPGFAMGYTKVRQMYPKVKFVKETNFQKQLLDLVTRGQDYVMFLVDDDIMVRPFTEDCKEFKEFQNNQSLISLSLRLSKAYQHHSLPKLEHNIWEWLSYRRGSPQFIYTLRDWGCLAVGGNILRKSDLTPLLKSNSNIKTPNYLEIALNAPKFKNRPLMQCFDEVKIVNNKANQVQSDFPTPKQSLNISVIDLNQRFISGDRLSLPDILQKSSGVVNGFIKVPYTWESETKTNG